MGTGALRSENPRDAIGAAAIVRDRNHWAQVCYSFRDGRMALGPSRQMSQGLKTSPTKEGASREG